MLTFIIDTEKKGEGKKNGGGTYKVIMVYLYIFGTPFQHLNCRLIRDIIDLSQH